MSDTKWTPGPWKAHATGKARSGKPEHEIHWSADGECIAEIVHGEPEAHLIAAAPDLYAALNYAAAHIEAELGAFHEAAVNAREQLAKARGDQ